MNRREGALALAVVAAALACTCAQFLAEEVGVVRECFGVEEVAGCDSGQNSTMAGTYYGQSVTKAQCFDRCYEQADCLFVAYFVAGGLCYNLGQCDVVLYGGAYSGWRFFRRQDFSGLCNPTEAPDSGVSSFVAGGEHNYARAGASTIGGGLENVVEAAATGGTIGGGQRNSIADAGTAAAVLSGGDNVVVASTGTVVGGQNHTVGAGGSGATVLSGFNNEASAAYAAVLGGYANVAAGSASTVGGGALNTASGAYGAVGGGNANVARGDYAVLGGGMSALLTANFAAVHGGYRGRALSRFAQVLGGSRNQVSGRFSAALGFRALVSGKYSCAMAFKSSGAGCTVTTRKSIGVCADQVHFGAGGLDLVELADAKAAIGRRRLGDGSAAGAATTARLLAEAVRAEADRVDAKLARLQHALAAAGRS